MVTETLAELEKAAKEVRDGLKNVNEDIKKLTGRDPTDNSRPVNRRVQLKRNTFQRGNRQEEPLVKQRRESDTTGTRRWGRTVGMGPRASFDESKLESSDDEDDSSKPAIQSVIATDLKPARLQSKDVEEDTKVKSRNRRMFGFLIGTLQKFKEDTRQKTQGEKKREEIEKKLEEKAEQEKKEISSQKRELFQTRREKQQELKSLERKMENTLLKEEILAHNKNLDNFIRLKCNPPLFYLPVKHNDATIRLLEESRETLKELQDARFKALDWEDDSHKMLRATGDNGKKVRDDGMEVKDVGHRDLFEEDREQDEFEKGEGDIMMEGTRKEDGWNEMEGERNEGSVSVTDRDTVRDRNGSGEAEEEMEDDRYVNSAANVINDNCSNKDGEKNEKNVEQEENMQRNVEYEMREEIPEKKVQNEEATRVEGNVTEIGESYENENISQAQGDANDRHLDLEVTNSNYANFTSKIPVPASGNELQDIPLTEEASIGTSTAEQPIDGENSVEDVN